MRYHVPLGIALGLAASVAVLATFDGIGARATARAVGGPVLSDCDGALRELVIHYVAETADVVLPTYRDFLGQLPRDVTVHVACPDRAAFDDLVSRLGPTRCELRPVVVGHAITTWSRDRWLALAPADGRAAAVVLSPRAEQGAAVWPARAGDQRVGDDLAAALCPNVAAIRSELYFDGGDFAADAETVFVRLAVVLRNLQRTVRTREELVARLEEVLKRKVVLLDESPDHHVGMFMMPVGDRTVLVGDPAAASRLLGACREGTGTGTEASGLCGSAGPDFTEATVARFEAVARQCQAAGYRVVRIPMVPGRDGRTYITYLNAILDECDGRRIVYLPNFSKVPELNRAAAEVWQGLGYEVRPVNCDACHPHFGSLHCLVNVLRRA